MNFHNNLMRKIVKMMSMSFCTKYVEKIDLSGRRLKTLRTLKKIDDITTIK